MNARTYIPRIESCIDHPVCGSIATHRQLRRPGIDGLGDKGKREKASCYSVRRSA